MRIAVPYEDGKISDHYGRTKCFKLYDVEDGAIRTTQLVHTDGQGHYYMVQFLVNHHVDLVLCEHMGAPARSALEIAGISLSMTERQGADEAVNAFLGEQVG